MGRSKQSKKAKPTARRKNATAHAPQSQARPFAPSSGQSPQPQASAASHNIASVQTSSVPQRTAGPAGAGVPTALLGHLPRLRAQAHGASDTEVEAYEQSLQPADTGVPTALLGHLIRLRAQAHGASDTEVEAYENQRELRHAITSQRYRASGASDAEIAQHEGLDEDEWPDAVPSTVEAEQVTTNTQATGPQPTAPVPTSTALAEAKQVTTKTQATGPQPTAPAPTSTAQIDDDEGWSSKKTKTRAPRVAKTPDQLATEAANLAVSQIMQVVNDQARWAYSGPSVYIEQKYKPYSAAIRAKIIAAIQAKPLPKGIACFYFPGAQKGTGRGTKGAHNFNVSGHTHLDRTKSKTPFQVHVVFD
jgi:hypothetical protein